MKRGLEPHRYLIGLAILAARLIDEVPSHDGRVVTIQPPINGVHPASDRPEPVFVPVNGQGEPFVHCRLEHSGHSAHVSLRAIAICMPGPDECML